FFATGSDIADSCCVASSGRCLRTNSMTFSSAPRSSLDVDVVAATAAGATGLRAGVGAVTRCRAGGAAVAIGAGIRAVVFSLAPAVARGASGALFGVTVRATGRAFGIGTLDLAGAGSARADNPGASDRLAVKITAVHRSGTRKRGGTASFAANRYEVSCSWLKLRKKYQLPVNGRELCAATTAKSRPRSAACR